MRSEEARAWSVLGALALAATDGTPTRDMPKALRALAAVTGTQPLAAWNDDPDRTKQEVLDALDSAIAQIEGDRP